MDHHAKPVEINADKVQGGPLGQKLIARGAVLAVVGLAAGFFVGSSQQDGMRHFWYAYLLNFVYFLTIAMGALFFVVLSSLSRFSWGVVVRRLAEVCAAAMPIMAILALPVLANLKTIYPWADPAVVAGNHLLEHKAPFLNLKFFYIRCAVYFGLWSGIAWFYFSKSVSQDQSGDVNSTRIREKISAPCIIAGAITFTFAAFDFVMSLDPTWFSTIFGVFFFAGSCVGFFAFVILLARFAQSSGPLAGVMNIEHYHDLGKFLFGFVFFWGYLGFSQYMLIWYGNLPEETLWYLHRQEAPWGKVALVVLFGHLIIPWLGLLLAQVKRTPGLLMFWAVWMLVAHWIDLFWLIMPEYSYETLPIGPLEVALFFGIGGVYLCAIGIFAKGKSLVPLKDPRLQKSLTFRNAP